MFCLFIEFSLIPRSSLGLRLKRFFNSCISIFTSGKWGHVPLHSRIPLKA